MTGGWDSAGHTRLANACFAAVLSMSVLFVLALVRAHGRAVFQALTTCVSSRTVLESAPFSCCQVCAAHAR
jgi:hypothetical protein